MQEMFSKIIDDSLEKVFANFLQKIKLKYSANTFSSYLFDIKTFFEFLIVYYKIPRVDLECLQNCSLDVLRLWISHQIENNVCSSSNNRAISALRSFYKFLKESDACHNNSIFLLNKARTPKNLPKAINYSDILYILQNINQVSSNKLPWQNMRDKAIMILMFTAGLRISEVLSLTRQKISTAEDFFYIIGKGDKERIVPLMPIAKQTIADYLAHCPLIQNDSLLFISNQGKVYHPRVLQRNIANIRRNINLPEYITPHSFRHACATEILNNGGDIRSIQALLGHSSIATTERYLKLDSERIIKKIIKKLDN